MLISYQGQQHLLISSDRRVNHAVEPLTQQPFDVSASLGCPVRCVADDDCVAFLFCLLFHSLCQLRVERVADIADEQRQQTALPRDQGTRNG